MHGRHLDHALSDLKRELDNGGVLRDAILYIAVNNHVAPDDLQEAYEDAVEREIEDLYVANLEPAK